MTLVDSNVLIDIASKDSSWAQWSLARLQTALRRGPLLINDIIYAEASVRYRRISDYDGFLESLGVARVSMADEALFLAGKAFADYRRKSETKTGVLPDFFIGAHAVVAGIPLLTRDVRRYRTYFPTIELITPDAD